MSAKSTVTQKVQRPESKTEAHCPPGAESSDTNLPEVSKQTAGGIAGAMVGGVVAGPLGAVVGGVVGAMVGNASAEGRRPIAKTVENIRAVAEPPARRAYASISKAMGGKKKAAAKPAAAKATPDKTPVHASAAKKSSKS